jgi:hypothetical protein
MNTNKTGKEDNNIMITSLKKSAAVTALVVILIGTFLTGCSASSSQTSSSSSGQQSSPTTSGQASTNESTQQQATPPGQQQFGGSNMTEILTRAAEILGISSDDFIASFQNAMPQGGPSRSGEQGQPPTAPSGQQGQPPTSGQQMTQSQFMTDIYAKMAEELNISADDIANAIQQAEEELQK